MVARDVYRWALIKHAAANPGFRSLAFPMPQSKYIDQHDKGPERNLKSFREARKITPKKSPLQNEVIYTAAELETAKPKPGKSARTSTYYVPFDPAPTQDALVMPKTPRRTTVRENTIPRITEVTLRSSSPRKEAKEQQQCRSNYRPPIRGVSMWFTAV